MYFYSHIHAPLPGGSFATHPAHAVFHEVLAAVCVVDLVIQVYTFYLMLRVATKQLSEYRFFMMLCTVGTGSRAGCALGLEPRHSLVPPSENYPWCRLSSCRH